MKKGPLLPYRRRELGSMVIAIGGGHLLQPLEMLWVLLHVLIFMKMEVEIIFLKAKNYLFCKYCYEPMTLYTTIVDIPNIKIKKEFRLFFKACVTEMLNP